MAVKVNDTLNFDFRDSDAFRSIRYAFAMDHQEFEDAVARIRESGISYGDSPREQENMNGPGMTAGAKGMGNAVYFKGPDSHLLEIKTYRGGGLLGRKRFLIETTSPATDRWPVTTRSVEHRSPVLDRRPMEDTIL